MNLFLETVGLIALCLCGSLCIFSVIWLAVWLHNLGDRVNKHDARLDKHELRIAKHE